MFNFNIFIIIILLGDIIFFNSVDDQLKLVEMCRKWDENGFESMGSLRILKGLSWILSSFSAGGASARDCPEFFRILESLSFSWIVLRFIEESLDLNLKLRDNSSGLHQDSPEDSQGSSWILWGSSKFHLDTVKDCQSFLRDPLGYPSESP